ncbi:MAG: excinuclease ABC subunit C [Calditrichaeota bacterium]|nr:excinuclease ABC subunit C [Calditrichota bacterium]
MSEELQMKLDNLPTRPGVYIFKDRLGRILYVGKAKVLRNRVRSYFQASRNEGPKLARLVSRIADVETIVTDSEVEALVLENNLIKEYKPRYNVNLKDDKSYPYIRVTNEPYPRVFATRRVVRDGSRYFGPYTDAGALRELLKTVQKIFPIRTCNLKLTDEAISAGKFKVCLDYHIKRCAGPCEGYIDRESYNELVEYVVDFIEGRDQRLVEQLQAKMKQLSAELRFEEAARIRDVLRSVERFQQRQKMVSTDLIDRDVVAGAVDVTDACAVIFKIREGRVVGRLHFQLSARLGDSLADVLNAFVNQYYLRTDFVPPEILVPVELQDQSSLVTWLREKKGIETSIRTPQDEDETKLVRMCQRNAELVLEEIKLQRLSSEEYVAKSVEALQRDLRLPKPPKRIEAFDISNIQGKHATASVVCFVNGRPHKSDYRKLRIRTGGPDDFAMMAEAVERHYRRAVEEKRPLPDLILIDGGKGQISAARSALERVGLKDIPLIGLAKRLDEVYFPGVPEPQNLPKGSPSLRLLQRVRDESHRFAVTYHRLLRSKRALESELSEIPGVGEKRLRALIETFGSVRSLAQASVDDIRQVPGIPKKVAEQIWEHFHRGSRAEKHVGVVAARKNVPEQREKPSASVGEEETDSAHAEAALQTSQPETQ